MIFGLWFEPERAGTLCQAVKQHPEYYINGRFFDFANEQAREYLLGVIGEQIAKYNVGWVKFDFNDTIPYDESGDGTGDSLMIPVMGDGSIIRDLVTDRTFADVLMRNERGTYNASDLNRISLAAQMLNLYCSSLGYSAGKASDRMWFAEEIPTEEELLDFYEGILRQDVLNYAKTKQSLPESLKNLDYEGANNIEKFLYLSIEAVENIPKSYIYADEIFGGEFN
jgi:alpha-glucosidase (family GH31 glycosyl hydrolase)